MLYLQVKKLFYFVNATHCQLARFFTSLSYPGKDGAGVGSGGGIFGIARAKGLGGATENPC